MLVLALKLGGKLIGVLVKLLKVTKSAKVVLAASSFGSYAILFNWKFALVFIASIFFHESGHVWAMRHYGMKVKGIYFLPFLGAAAVTNEKFPSHRAEAIIALMGPIWGFGLAAATYALYLASGSPLIAGIAAWMCAINLFNLLPIHPLDGGRIVHSIAFSVRSQNGFLFLLFTLVVGMAGAWIFKFFLLAVVTFAGLLELLAEWKNIGFDEGRKQLLEALAKELGLDHGADAKTVCAEIIRRDRGTGTFFGEDMQRFFRGRMTAIIEDTRAKVDAPRNAIERRLNPGSLVPYYHFYSPHWHEESEDVLYASFFTFLQGQETPRMSGRGCAGTVAVYAALIGGLIGLMLLCNHIPAAKAAFNLFTE